MCGRFTLTADKVEVILERFNAEVAPGFDGYKPRYNVAPGQPVPVIVTKDGKRYLTNMFWGFIAPWGEKSDGSTTSQANIRDDTIGRNRFFHDRLLKNRCIVVADGFYEWKKPQGYEDVEQGRKLPKGMKKTPYRITMKNRLPFALAGLWRSIEADTKRLVTAGIITTEPNELMAPIHDRMPVVLGEAGVNLWLDQAVDRFDTLYGLLVPYPENDMEVYEVTTAINNSRNDSPACIEAAP